MNSPDGVISSYRRSPLCKLRIVTAAMTNGCELASQHSLASDQLA
jgi:hypothetical protein